MRPYAAMFGYEAKIGLTSSALPTEVIATMQNEDDLVAALTSSSSQNSTAEAATDDSTDDSTVQIPVPSTSSAVPDRDDDEALNRIGINAFLLVSDFKKNWCKNLVIS